MKAILRHISIIVSSEASVAFYSRLGFKEIKRIFRDRDFVVLMEGNGMMLELFVDPSHPNRASKPENLGIRCFSLETDNLDSAIKELECDPIKTDWFGKRYCFTYDPDGLPVQLHE